MWNLSSRVHQLNHFPNEGVVCYVKRDDELSCGISGSKLRKYSSLLPYLLKQNIKRLIIIAGSQSNNLLAALQIAREYQLEVTAFLLQSRNLKIQGNYKLSSLFINEEEIFWVTRDEWPHVEQMAAAYLNKLNEPAYILKEGASVFESMEGAMSLARDIIDNEVSLGIKFNHIFVDAGTGFTAAALINGLMQFNHQSLIHVLLLADDEVTFREKLHGWLDEIPENVQCFHPQTAQSFGSVNQTIKNEIRRLAREEGILADPVYSAKLFYASRIRIESLKLKGNVLIIHSGGVLTMAGFEL